MIDKRKNNFKMNKKNTWGTKVIKQETTSEEKERGITNFLDKNKFPTIEIWNDEEGKELYKKSIDKLKTLSHNDKIEFGKSISFTSNSEREREFKKLIPKEISREEWLGQQITYNHELSNEERYAYEDELLNLPEKDLIEYSEKETTNARSKKAGVEDYYNLFKEKIEESYFNQNKEPYITIKVGEHKEHHQINSQSVKDIILITCHKSGLGTPTEQNINQIISMLRAECLIENEIQQVNLRFYQTEDSIYYDPCRKDWKVYKISRENIELGYFDNIKFERFNHMKESTPNENANEEDIKLFLNDFEMSDNERLVSKVNLIYTHLQKPKPIDNISGAMGSGKTVATKQIRQITDPSELEVLFFPETTEELLLLARQHAVLPFDNIRHINNKTSDILCSISTGASTSQRKLYTNGETQITKIQRKIIMNGINRSGDNSDYADRSIELTLKRIPTTKRKTETEVWNDFNKSKSNIQGACLKILQKTLSIIDTIKLKSIPRMADFAVWGEAISQAMGEEKNKFIDIYFKKINNLSEEILESNDVARTILVFADMKKEWQGTPGEFYKEINYVAENILKINILSKYWISSPIALSKKVNEFQPILEYKNIFITKGKKNGIRFIKIQDKTKIEKEQESIRFLVLEKLSEDKRRIINFDEIEDYIHFLTHNHVSLHELRLELNKLKQEGVIDEPKANHYQFLE